jgi:hypothetical protein
MGVVESVTETVVAAAAWDEVAVDIEILLLV